jgi:undecaprenyl-diphosphatase
MSLLHAIILGILQGFAEPLPISSSAHLSLAPVVFGWEADQGLAFDVALHLGTLITLIWYFRRDWSALTRAAVGLLGRRRLETVDDWRVLFLVVATIPAAIGGLLLEDLAETAFRSPTLTATTLIVMGGVLWAADRFSRRDRDLATMRWTDALIIGLAQVAALVPGVSRSGSTMTAGRALGFERPDAARFSFLMSMPITAAAVVLKAPEAVQQYGVSVPLVAGVVCAAVASWAAIAVLLRYVASHSFGVFAVYRLVVGAGVLLLLASRA